jgi:hypothetical protein
MTRPTSSGSIRRLVRTVRAAQHRSSEQWIQRIEDPGHRDLGRR